MNSGEDLLRFIPAYIRPVEADSILTTDNMIGCSISANPMEHIKTPTYVYIRGKKRSIWSKPRDNAKSYDKSVGSYCLKGAQSPYRLQILDIPAWLLNLSV